jgi:uncharacterized RDD family membrane protein YckC
VEHNPYAPPKANVSDPVRVPEDDELASRGQRFVNFIIDWVVRAVLVACAQYGLIDLQAREIIDPPGFLVGLVPGYIAVLIYYLSTEGVFGRSLGKLVTRTRVVTVDGGTPTFLQILGRTVSRWVPFEAFSFFGGPPVVGWHDSWSNTRVVRISYAR